ncbi:hypothetical protein [Pedobacter suwonensis]|uniref:hypothetical protein n=1 Tax=Pedobacter suwonensis TaxID=332999 RepID=UPI0025F1F559|nr:hypothetical protein [uncultured Pedobacter sp.]
MKKILRFTFLLYSLFFIENKCHAQSKTIHWEGTYTVSYQGDFKIKIYKVNSKYKAIVTTEFTDQLCNTAFPDEHTITLYFEKNTRGKGLSFIKNGDWIIQIKNIRNDYYFMHRGFPLTSNPDDIRMKKLK